MSNSEGSTVLGIGLPTGGRLLASATLTQLGECSAATNLQVQVAPLVAAFSCQFAILRLLKPLTQIILALPNPAVADMAKFAELAIELEPCLLAPTAAMVMPFARDLLCLEIRSLRCLQKNLQSVAALAAIQPSAVAASDVQAVIDSYQPIVGILELAGPLLQMVGVSTPTAPPLADGTDLNSLSTDQQVIAEYVSVLQLVTDVLGGCS